LINTGKLGMTPRQLFIVDAAGGFLAAAITMAIVAFFDDYFGVPNHWLIVFIVCEVTCGCFSLATVFSAVYWSTNLKIIATANSICGIFTISILIANYPSLTTLDYIYFCAEIAVLILLIRLEIRIYYSIIKQS